MTPGDPGFNPFPGLRPFDMDEEYLFFGREEQRKELVSLLREQRFVAVLGASGSGKSSLVRAGLLPALYGGVMTRAGSNWHIAVMRPGGHAITNLAEALFDTDLLDNEICEDLTELDIEASLIRSSLGLIEVARQLGLQKNENLLIVVDQFEELFRFNSSQSDRGSRDEAAAFVKMLVEAAMQQELSIYVVLTMRSDFFGDCSQFEELADAVNKGEYLVPRLNRENKKTAIEGPVRVGGGEISPRLVQRLLNDLGDDPDQLPIMQHALMRTWDCWLGDHNENEPLDLRHYEATGGMDEALSRHADEVHAEATTEEEQRLTKQLFQALTEKGADNRGIRRPTPLKELCEISGANKDQVSSIIDRFRKPGRTFLMPPIDRELEGNTVIDISHESLMRVWASLGRWVDDEGQSARIYLRLAETAQLHADGSAGLYHDPDLQIALSWRDTENPTEAWGQRYHPEYSQSIAFLDQSHEVKLKEQRAEEVARERELEQAKLLAKAEQERAEAQQQLAVKQRKRAKIAAVLAGLALIATAVAGVAWNQSQKNETLAKQAQQAAVENATKATEAQQVAEAQEALAKQSQQAAEEARQNAEIASKELSNNLTQSDFVTGVELLEANRTSDGLAYLARAIRRDPTHWQSTMRAMSTLQHNNFNLDMRPELTHEKPAQAPLISKDGKTILTYVNGAEAKVWSIDSGRLISEFGSETKSKDMKLSPNGAVAADLDVKNIVHLWDTSSGNKIGTISPDEGIITFDFVDHPEKTNLIATYNGSGALQVWDLEGKERTSPLRTTGRFVGSRNTRPKITEDNKFIYGIFDDGKFGIWDILSGKEKCAPIEHKLNNPSIYVSPDSSVACLKSSNGRKLRWWSTISSNPIVEEMTLERGYRDVYFSPNNQRIFIAGYTARAGIFPGKVSIKVFDTNTGQLIFNPIKEEQQIWSLPHFKSGRHFMVSDANNMKVIDLRNGELLSKIPRQEHDMTHGYFSPSGDRIAIIYSNNTVRIWDSLLGVAITEPLAHRSIIGNLKFSDDGTKIATRDGMENARIWNAWTGELIAGPLRHRGFATFSGNKVFAASQEPPTPFPFKSDTFVSYDMSLTRSPKGQYLTVGKTHLWPSAPRESSNLPVEKGWYSKIEFNSKSDLLIAAKRIEEDNNNHIIQFWETESRSKTHEIEYPYAVKNIIAHPRQNIAIAQTTNTLAHVLSLDQKTIIGSIDHQCIVGARRVAFSKDKHTLGIAKGKSAYAWDWNTQKLLNKINCQNFIYSISLSDDSNLLCAGELSSNEANVWEVSTGNKICGPLKHENIVLNSIFYNQNNQSLLITASADNKIRIWNLPNGKLLRTTGDENWPVYIDQTDNLFLTAGVGNDSYPSSIRIWNMENMSKQLPAIPYRGAIYASRFMNSGKIAAAADNKGNFQAWDSSTGKPLIQPIKDMYWVKISNDEYYASSAANALRIYRIPREINNAPNWFADFIEAISGQALSESGIAKDVSKEKLQESIDFITSLDDSKAVTEWAKWFISNPVNRTSSPNNNKSFQELISAKSKSSNLDELREALTLDPTKGVIYSRIARSIAQPVESPRTETIDHVIDDNLKSWYVNYDTLNSGVIIELSNPSPIHGIRIHVHRIFDRNPKSFELAISEDNINFNVAETGQIPLFTGKSLTFEKEFNKPIDSKYVRITFPTVRNAGTLDHFSNLHGVELSELELLGANGNDITKSTDLIKPTNNEHKNYNSPAEHYALTGTKLEPNISETWWSLADVYDLMGKHNLARLATDKALALNPNDPNALYVSSLLRERAAGKEKLDQMSEFSKAIEIISNSKAEFDYLDPLLQSVYDLKSYQSTNLTQLALSTAQKKFWGNEGVFAVLLSEYAASTSGEIQALIDYTRVLFYRSESEKALGLLDNALKDNPNNPELLFNLGGVYRSLSKTTLALQAYQKASRLFKTDNADSLRNRRIAFASASSILSQQGKLVEAYQERIKGKIVLRQKSTESKYIDLSTKYNAPLDEKWYMLSRSRGGLSLLPTGLTELDGAKYDIRGIVQLSGRQLQNALGKNNPFPRSVKNIDFSNQRYRSINFLHATTWTDPDGTPVANYVINYSDGTSHVLPIVYGEHVRDWVIDTNIGLLDTPKSKIGWRSSSIALFQTTWANPHPQKEIQSIDLESEMSFSNVFIIGITGNPDSAGEGESPSNNN